jgi:pimeloyl-ACP methyl ester carboxylesterase
MPLEPALRARFQNPTVLGRDLRATFVFETGATGTYGVRVRDGVAKIARGETRKPTCTVTVPGLVLRAILEGKRSGIDAFLDGSLTVRGNLALALQLDDLFEHPPRPVTFPRARRIVAHDVETFVLEAGEGFPIFFLHGLGATNSSMLPPFAGLSRSYRTIAPDLPGFGETAKPLRAYHPAFFARWLIDLMDRLQLPRAHLVGNSMGGRIALEVALRYPDRVGKLGLLCPSMAFRKLRHAVPIVKLLAPQLAIAPLTVPRIVVRHALDLMFHDPRRVPTSRMEAATDEFLRIYGTPRGRIAFLSAMQQIYLEDAFGERGFWDRLPSLARPALFLFGDSDLLVPDAFLKHVQDAVPSARCVRLHQCGHVPQFEHPALTNELLDGFFRDV